MISVNSIKALAAVIRKQRQVRGAGTDGTARALAQQAVIENVAVDLWDSVLFYESPGTISRKLWFALCAVQDPLIQVVVPDVVQDSKPKRKVYLGRLRGVPKGKTHVKR